MSAGALFVAFARMGALAFGGGPSMIPLMKAECVGGGFVTESQFVDGLAIGNALPGPIATKVAVYVGYSHLGVAGAGIALAALLLPSTAMIALVMAFLTKYADHPAVKGALAGSKPALVGMLFFTAFDLAPAGVKNPSTALLAVAAFVALLGKVHPAFVIVAALAIGAVLYR